MTENAKPNRASRTPATSAELNNDYANAVAVVTAAEAEWSRLREEESAAARAGVDVLREHRRKMEDVKLRGDVAAQQAKDLALLRDEAIERERDEARQAALSNNKSEGDAWADEVRKVYGESLLKLQNLLTRGKEIQLRRDLINRDGLPKGAAPLDHVEEKIRWLAAEPDREEEVEVERPFFPEGTEKVFKVGEKVRTQKVKEKRVVKGAAAIRPAPLWESFQAAGLKPGDPYFIVPGVRFRRND